MLHPLGAVVVDTGETPPLPFGDEAFELVTGRHPSNVWWDEFARVLKPGGAYFAQHVGVIGGSFVTRNSRVLIEARKPRGDPN